MEVTSLASLVPALGATGAVVVVVYYFLRHIAEEAKLSRETMSDLVVRTEKMEAAHDARVATATARFESMLSATFAEQRRLVEGLMSLNRETVAAVRECTDRLERLDEAIARVACLHEGEK